MKTIGLTFPEKAKKSGGKPPESGKPEDEKKKDENPKDEKPKE